MTTLLIARHGNTFKPEETPTRVGAKTDLPLVESGIEQAKRLGIWLKDHQLFPAVTYSSELQRTKETAKIILQELKLKQPVFPLAIFNEIDYGPDENQTEDTVIKRIGQQAINDWNINAIVPNGWQCDPDKSINNWKNFAKHIIEDDHADCVLVVTSNGIARFAPHITGNFEEFSTQFDIKLSTGALGIFQYEHGKWSIQDWNIRP